MKRQTLKDERGQAIVEFAIALPLLMVVLVAIVQFGISFSHYLTLADAVRSGARAASVNASSGAAAATTAGRSAVLSAAPGLVQPGDVQVTSPTWHSGDPVTVTAKAPYALDILGIVVRSGWLQSSTTQRLE